ncbi:MAG: hypothetical protein A2Z46_09370 [Nitrospirae bacterium RBG_19FT_COMBO_55_12]|nr:MAG: hypothetical protein A2Z46_09370 [Nitrospirae bacterium RBG_19FT_COMBO_55_12]
MHSEKDDDRTYRLDEEHLRILQEIEKTTHQSVTSQIREGIELFIRSKKCDPHSLSIFSPIIFERPYRSHDQ